MNEEDLELLNDMMESPGWDIFLKRVFDNSLTHSRLATAAAVGAEEFHKASRALGRTEGAAQLIMNLYTVTKRTPPESLRSFLKG